jgi:hypothetical protein
MIENGAHEVGSYYGLLVPYLIPDASSHTVNRGNKLICTKVTGGNLREKPFVVRVVSMAKLKIPELKYVYRVPIFG